MGGGPGAAAWVITRLARFSAFAFAIVPAIVTGLVIPPRDIDIEETGSPARANSTWASTAPRSNERGAVGHTGTERSGRRLRASSEPATRDATRIWVRASAAVTESPWTCFSVFCRVTHVSWRLCAAGGTSPAVTWGQTKLTAASAAARRREAPRGAPPPHVRGDPCARRPLVRRGARVREEAQDVRAADEHADASEDLEGRLVDQIDLSRIEEPQPRPRHGPTPVCAYVGGGFQSDTPTPRARPSAARPAKPLGRSRGAP